jgi:hypothetical protein
MTISAWPSPTRWQPSQNGARQVECTINGIGERAGNAALEEIAAALYVRGDRYGITTSIKLDKLYPTSQVLGQIITFKPSPNKAIVGDNAFAHESGIHQHGMLANPLCYEIMTPALVGVAKTQISCSASTPAAPRCGIVWSSSASRSPRRAAADLLPLRRPGRPQEEHLRPGPDRPAARQIRDAATSRPSAERWTNEPSSGFLEPLSS